MLGHDLIKAGSATVVVAGGMESMTNAPHMVSARTGIRYGEAKLVDHMAWDGLTNPYDGQSMGVFAEACADKYNFTREEQDAFAIESVKRAQAAIASGAFAEEIVPVKVAGRKGEVEYATDEQPGKSDTGKDSDAASGIPQGRNGHRRQFVEHLRWRCGHGAAERRRRKESADSRHWRASSHMPPIHRNRNGSLPLPSPRSKRS